MMDFQVDREACTTCGECAKDCVANVIVMTEDSPVVPPGNEARRIGCQHCLAVCKPGAIRLDGLRPEDCPPVRGVFPSPAAMTALIKGRRSVRRYKKEAVDRETLAALMDATLHAPTAKNVRDGKFLLVDDPAVMDEVRLRCLARIARALETPNPPARFTADADYYRMILKSDADPIFRGAPHMLVASCHKDNVWGWENTIIALSYFELLAQSMGLGTVWCGRAWQVFSTVATDVLTSLGLPEDQRVGYVMLFGKPAVKYHRGARYDPSKYLTAAFT